MIHICNKNKAECRHCKKGKCKNRISYQECYESEKCQNCYYSIYLSNRDRRPTNISCNYILDEGKPRPCPTGDECTVYIEGATRRRMELNGVISKRTLK